MSLDTHDRLPLTDDQFRPEMSTLQFAGGVMLEVVVGKSILTAIALIYWGVALVAVVLAWKIPDWNLAYPRRSLLSRRLPAITVAALFVLTAFGLPYWGVAVVVVVLAWKIPDWSLAYSRQSLLIRRLPAIIVIAVYGYQLAQAGWEHHKSSAHYAEAKALFDEKCKTSGERIYKTVNDVRGLLLPKVRATLDGNLFYQAARDPMWPDAALFQEHNGDEYIRDFLLDRRVISITGPPQNLMGRRIVNDVAGPGAERGMRFIDVIDAKDGKRYRVSASAAPRDMFKDIYLDKDVTDSPPPRYAVTFENNVDPGLRKYWIAGTTVIVLDTETNEKLGEMEVWRFDRSQRHTDQSMPWATSDLNCPNPPFGSYGQQTHYFVEKILKGKQGN